VYKYRYEFQVSQISAVIFSELAVRWWNRWWKFISFFEDCKERNALASLLFCESV